MTKNEKSKNSTYIGAMGEPIFLTPGVKSTFNQLRQAFIKAPILQNFDLKSHIGIETNTLGHAIGGLFS